MESIGEKLRQTRESKGYTIEQIARDTHIAKRFLEALEAEDFGVFPGDPYLLGFMRTYSQYLGLDPEDVVSLYKNLKLQEQPAPIDELISRSPTRPIGLLVLIIAVVVIALGVGGYFLISSGILGGRSEPEVAEDLPDPPAGTIFELSGEWVEQRFTEGDRIVVPVGGEQLAMDLASVGDSLTITTPQGPTEVDLGIETTLDLNGDGRPDVWLILRSVDTLDTPSTVVMRVNRGAVEAEVADLPADTADPVSDTGPDVGSTFDPSRVQERTAIAEFAEKEEFFVEVRFEGYTLFRYEVDSEPRVEQYFQQGQTLRTSVRDQFRLWASNAGVARMRVAGKDIVLGSAGQVSAAVVAWADVPDSSNVRLELVPAYWSHSFYIENLGCAKNQVDAEIMIQALSSDGWKREADAADASVIIVNSCGFIEPAKQETIDTVLEFSEAYPDAQLVMAGCLSQRYSSEIAEEMPELAAVVGNRAPAEIAGFLRSMLADEARIFVPGAGSIAHNRESLLSLPGSAFVKVAEGCDNRCSFCAIPLIRGNLRSRPVETIAAEVSKLLDRGVVEINLVAQDLAAFGRDTGEDLEQLLGALLSIDRHFWIRPLYVYPEHFPGKLLDICSADPRLLPYFDIPVQHASPAILKRMGRPATAQENIDLISRIRERLPDAFIRSTFLVGFYGETDEDFDLLLDFQERAKIDWLGVFTYSPEEGTPAQRFHGKLDLPQAEDRRDEVMRRQEPITFGRVDRLVGRDLDVLVEEPVPGEPLHLGRVYAQAPEVDGAVVINTGFDRETTEVKPGTFLPCRIVRRNGLDVEAVPI